MALLGDLGQSAFSQLMQRQGQAGIQQSVYSSLMAQQARDVEKSMFVGIDPGTPSGDRTDTFTFKKKNQTIREELQDNVDEWIKDVL